MSKDKNVCVFCELPKEADKDLCNACIADDKAFYDRIDAILLARNNAKRCFTP